MSTTEIYCKPLSPSNSAKTVEERFNKLRVYLSAGAHFRESEISEKVRLKRFGASEDEMKKWSAMKRMGVTQEEVDMENSIRISNPSDKACDRDATKVEKMTGCSVAEMKRSKALATLGASEQECSESRSRRLGNIGKRGSNGDPL